MKLIGLVRLGRDAELRYASSGTAVLGFSGAYNYGKRGENGQPSQWVEFALFGKRAESLAEHLTKGAQVFIVASDVRVETYKKGDGGQGVKLACVVDDIQFAGSREKAETPRQEPRQAPRTARTAPAKTATHAAAPFDDMDSDIPFISCSPAIDMAGPLARRMRRYGGDL
jgi:single-strand DNA-binding protein